MIRSPLHLPPKLDALPVEILTQIFKFLPQHPRALAKLCRVCKALRFVATELLYNDITVVTVEKTTIDPMIVRCLLYVENPGITYIRKITVRGNVRNDLQTFDELEYAKLQPTREDGCSSTIMNMALVLCMVLDKIPEGRLESFTWDVNSFFSWMLADKLRERHPHLKLLQLRDGDGDDGPWDRTWLGAMKFLNLQSLGWGNITSHDVLAGLRSFDELKDNHLKDLDIYEEDADEVLPENFLFKALLGTRTSSSPQSIDRPSLPDTSNSDGKQQLDLERLLLEECPLNDSAHGLMIDLSNLRTLSLRRCPDTCQFLESWVTSTNAIKLKSLELLLEAVSEPESIVTFLNAFAGLEDLYLLLENPEDTSRVDEIFESIYHHEKTLRRLVVDFKQYGETMGIPVANAIGIKKRLKIRELGITFKPEEGVGVSGSEFLPVASNNQTNIVGTVSTIHIRNLLQPTYAKPNDPFVCTRNFLMSKTFRHRKADAEAMIKALNLVCEDGKAGNLEAIVIGPIDEGKLYECSGAATGFSCFLVDYVKTRADKSLPVLNPVSVGDLRYFGVPCDVTKVQW